MAVLAAIAGAAVAREAVDPVHTRAAVPTRGRATVVGVCSKTTSRDSYVTSAAPCTGNSRQWGVLANSPQPWKRKRKRNFWYAVKSKVTFAFPGCGLFAKSHVNGFKPSVLTDVTVGALQALDAGALVPADRVCAVAASLARVGAALVDVCSNRRSFTKCFTLEPIPRQRLTTSHWTPSFHTRNELVEIREV